MIANRQLGILAGGAAILAIVAIMVTSSRTDVDTNVASESSESRLLSHEFPQQVNDVTVVKLSSDDEMVTLELSTGVWMVSERDGYPADAGKIRELLRGMARSERVAQKTANPDLFGRMDLDEKAVHVQALDAAGDVLASVRFGKRDGFGEDAETFVRVEGEQNAWLVDGLPAVTTGAADWIEKSLLDVSKDRVKSVILSGVDQEAIEITRETPDGEFSLVGLKETEELSFESVLDASMAAISALTIEEVRSAEGLPDAAETGTYTTFDGLTLTIGLVKDGEDEWLKIDAGYDPAVIESEAAPEVMPGAPEDGAAEAATIIERTKGRAFKIASYKLDDFRKKRGDLVREKTPSENSEES